jgi:hypothetical protein
MQKHRCLYGDHKRVNNETAPLSHTPKLYLIYLWLMYKYAYIHFSLSLTHTHTHTATILHHSILGSLPLLPLLPKIYCRIGKTRQWKQQNRNKVGAERKTWRNTLKCTTEIITKYRENKWVILFGTLISTRHKNWIAWTTQSKSTSSTGRSHFTHFLFALFHFKATWKFTPLFEFTK